MDHYPQLRNYETDFDRAQAEVRRAGAVWIVATFSALAYVVMPGYGPEDINISALAVIVLGVISSVGFFALWWVDQHTYQRLLHAIFVYGLYVEWKEQAKTGNLRPRSAMYAQELKVVDRLSVYYHAPMALMSTAAIFAYLLYDTEAVVEIMTFVDGDDRLLRLIQAFIAGLAIASPALTLRCCYLARSFPFDSPGNLIQEYGSVFGEDFTKVGDDPNHKAIFREIAQGGFEAEQMPLVEHRPLTIVQKPAKKIRKP